MARQPKSSSRAGRKIFLLLVLIALILVAAYFMKDCGLGDFGLGKGPGAGGTASPSASAAPSASVALSASASEGGEPFSIRVTGTGCKVGSEDKSQSCEDACASADAATKGRDKREVKLHPSAGSQEVVEALRTCLKDKGMVTLEVRD